MAASLGLLASGGSDYHGEGAHRTARLGGASCPREEFMRLEARAAQALRTASRATASGSGAV
jgi:hypothetical protein